MSAEIKFDASPKTMGLNWRSLIARGIETIIGGILLISGLLKAWEPLVFAQQIGDYKIITQPTLIKILVWVMIAVECGLGAALIAGFRRRIVIPITCGLFVVFLSAVGWAWATGATEDCGCFGSWVKRTPAEAFTEDLIMLAAIASAWFLNRYENRIYYFLRFGFVGIAMIAGLALTGYSSQSARQSSDPVVRMQAEPESPFTNVPVGLVSVDLMKEKHLVVLIDTGCSHCQAAVPEFNKLMATTNNRPPLIALCSNTEEDVKSFKQNFSSRFPIGIISRADFLRLLETGGTPHTLLVNNGKVTRIWDGDIPQPTELVGN